MKFTATTLTLFITLGMSAVVREAAPNGMGQRLDTRDVSSDLIFGRSFDCSSNDPSVCCAKNW
ncbi:hypothetical protein F4809DRAFT_657435 [Biscogniauxia mediterranea]|nr:hypothetical protein F4809DRAFT_657435 [Biscogniauxia mediterranea]